MSIDNFQSNLVRVLDPLHFKWKWRGSGSLGVNQYVGTPKLGSLIKKRTGPAQCTVWAYVNVVKTTRPTTQQLKITKRKITHQKNKRVTKGETNRVS